MYGIGIRNLMKNKGSKGDRVTQTVRGGGGGGGFEVAVGQQEGGAGRQLESPPTCPASSRQGGRQGECRREYT